MALEEYYPTDCEREIFVRHAGRIAAYFDGREIDVVDLSPEGFRAETSFTLWPGTIVWLTLPGLAPLEAVIAWRDRFKYGCAFSKPLRPAVFEHIVALGNR